MGRGSFWHSASLPVLTTSLTFIIYFFTLAPDLTWANFGVDGGELITASYTLGVAHPPGYPTYILLGKLFSLLPWQNVAYGYNLFSAICMALAVGMVTLTAVHLTDQHYLASVTGLSFGLASLVWGQATIAEVYALNALCLSVLLWMLLCKLKNSPPTTVSFFIGILQGFALTTHPTSLFFLPLTSWQAPQKKLFGFGVLLGLTPFALLPLLGLSGQVWGDPTHVQGWWQLVSGQIYQANSFSLASQPYWADRVWQLAGQLTPVGAVAVGVGLFAERRQVIWGVAGTAVLFISYALTYNTPDGLLFAIPALLIAVLLMLPALEKVGVVSLLLPVVLFINNIGTQNLRHDTHLRDRAIPFLAELPPDSVVVTTGDASIFAFWYFQQVEAVRPDITIVEQTLLHFAWYHRTLNNWQAQKEHCVVSLADSKPSCHWRTEKDHATSGNK